ncbi:hypothetical protein ACWDTI_26890 [Gordonia sp. NPDC003424]
MNAGLSGTGVMLILILALGAAAAGCALIAAYVYLRGSGNPVRDERTARRWLVGTAVFGVSALVLRFALFFV